MPGVIAPPAALGGQAGDATPGGFGNATGGFNVNGMRNQSNNFLLDGAPNNDTFNTGFVLRPPPDAIDEFRIFTHAFNAEYGRNAGAVVSVVTRAGSQRVARLRLVVRPRRRARGAQPLRRDASRRSISTSSAARAGGPLVENRAFVFGYYEGFRNRRGTTDTRVVPSAAQRAGDFSGGAGDPRSADRTAVPGQRHSAGAPRRHRDAAARRLRAAAEPAGQPLHAVAGRPGSPAPVRRARRPQRQRVDTRCWRACMPPAPSSATRSGQPTSRRPATSRAASLLDALVSDTLGARADASTNEARVSINRIDAEPNVTSGLDPRDLGFAITPSNPTALGLPNIGVNGFFTLGDAQQPFASRVNEVLDHRRRSDEGRRPPHRSRAASRSGAIASRSRSSTGRTATSPSTASTPATPPPTSCSACRSSTGRRPAIRTWTATPGRRASTCRTTGGVADGLSVQAGLRYERAAPFVERGDKLNAFHPGAAVDALPGRADRPRLSRRPRRAARHLRDRRQQRRAAARRGLGRRRRRQRRSCAAAGGCSTTRRRGRATSSRTARWRRRSSR